METAAGTEKQNGKGIGPGFPKSDENPEGYTMDERARRDKPKERQSKRGAGRKGKDGMEENIDFHPIKEACGEMMKAAKKAELANSDYNDVVKKVAERSGVNAGSLKRLVKSSLKGNYADVRRAIDQQAVLFETIGEIPAGPGGATA